MIRAVGAACALVLVLAACSDDPDDTPAETSASESAEPVSALAELTGDDLCAALPGETIEEHLGVAVAGNEGQERGRAPVMRTPYFLSRECDYDTDGLPGLRTSLSTEWDESTSDAEILDKVFTDVSAEPESVGDYDEISDLGVTAGYGDDALLASADLAGSVLGVVLRAGEERLLLTMSTTGSATLEQLRPLADELMANLAIDAS